MIGGMLLSTRIFSLLQVRAVIAVQVLHTYEGDAILLSWR